MARSHNTYDAIIIGAGISGLVCGCYLAKAGMKVLIVEQHSKPGGYCTSFKRKGFTFDAAAHSIGGYKYGHVGRILKDLEIEKKLEIIKIDPSDTIITPDYKISYWSNITETIKEFQSAFPEEKENIKKFISLLITHDPKFLMNIRSLTFKKLLDKYFINEQLKAILSFPLFGNGGLPPSLMSAFLGTKIFQEFLLDGGYYPKGGMQMFSNAFAERFKELGGELRLSCLANKIKVKDNKTVGVVLENDGFLESKYVVSNCDARQTFLTLIGKNRINQDFLKHIKTMIPSLSGFILYLGMNNKFNKNYLLKAGVNSWVLSYYNLETAFRAASKGDFNNVGGYVVHVSPDKKTVFAFMNAPYKNKRYWDSNKKNLMELFIARIESDIIPELSKYIIYKDAATPCTLQRYTLNYKGAAFGWAGTPSQLADHDLKKPSFLKNLYLTGHWTTHGLGIPGVVYVGYDVASSILRRKRE